MASANAGACRLGSCGRFGIDASARSSQLPKVGCPRDFDLQSVGSGLLRRDYVRRQTDYIGNRQATGREFRLRRHAPAPPSPAGHH